MTTVNNKEMYFIYVTRSLLMAIVFLLLLPYNVFAQNRMTIAEAERTARAASTAFGELEPQVEQLRGNIGGLERSVENRQSEINQLCGNLSETQCSLELDKQMRSSNRTTRKRAREQHQNLRALQQTRNNIKSALDKVKKEYDSKSAGLRGLSRTYERSTGQLSPEVLQARLRGLDIKTDLLELTGDVQDIDTALDNIADVYDRSLLGAYFQDKITKLLTGTQPDLICRANSRCRSGGQGPSAVEVRNALFLENNRVRRSAPAPAPNSGGGTGLAD